MSNVYRMPAGQAEETKVDPFPAEKAPPTEADRLRCLKVAAAAISGSANRMWLQADRIVEGRCSGKFEPTFEEQAQKVDECIAVLEIAVAQWKAAR